MAGTLSIVATPIGHLDDITLRALNVLRSVDLIAAEDTRRTGRLLAHYGISTKTVSFHEHNTRARLSGLIRQLKEGRSIALVSDAGTPVVSDPGLELVQQCIQEGIAVEPIPGPSAPLTLAVASGFDFCPWTVYGFPPSRSSDRKRWFEEVTAVRHAVTFFESPHRIIRTLTELSIVAGNRPICLGRELTKVHQTLYRGTVRSVLSDGIEELGEFTVMLGPLTEIRGAVEAPVDSQLFVEFGEITNGGRVNRREAVKQLAARHSMPVRDVYAAVERAKAKG